MLPYSVQSKSRGRDSRRNPIFVTHPATPRDLRPSSMKGLIHHNFMFPVCSVRCCEVRRAFALAGYAEMTTFEVLALIGLVILIGLVRFLAVLMRNSKADLEPKLEAIDTRLGDSIGIVDLAVTGLRTEVANRPDSTLLRSLPVDAVEEHSAPIFKRTLSNRSDPSSRNALMDLETVSRSSERNE